MSFVFGLGKTPTALAWSEDLIECGEAKTGWVVTDGNLKYQWLGTEGGDGIDPSGILGFTDSSAIVIDGNPKERKAQYREAMTGRYQYIVIGYTNITNEWEKVRHLPRDFVIADEITAIKNPWSQRTKAFTKVDSPRRLGLSGAPIENKIEDAFFILRWIDPDVFGPFHVFERVFIERDRFGNVVRCKDPELFRELLDSVMVRSSEEDRAENLPDVINGGMTPHYVRFDPFGESLYNSLADGLVEELREAASKLGSSFNLWAHYTGVKDNPVADAIRGRVMSYLLCIRLLCDHPDLLHVSAEKYDRTGGARGAARASELRENGLLLPMGSRSPKLAELIKQVQDFLDEDEDNKIVIFTAFTEMLSILAEMLAPEAKYVTFHGGKTAKAKDAARRAFNEDPEVRLFLTSDAGGYGLNLPVANLLINYDLPWGAGKQGQRNARIVRMSSEWDEVEQRALLMEGSVEERMLDLIAMQTRMSERLVDGRGKGGLSLGIGSLVQFLEETRP